MVLLEWGLVVAFGLCLGLVYFGGLWWTVQRIPETSRPHRWLVLSFVGRAAGVLLGFFAVLQLGNALHLLAALLGFVGIRWFVVRRVNEQPA